MHAKFEQKMKQLQEEHHNELQKYKISQVMNDFSKRYQFEDKMTDQQMVVKQMTEQNETHLKQIQTLEDQIAKARN